MYLDRMASERARIAIACTTSHSTRARAILNMVAANRKDPAPSAAIDTRAEWCARWRKRVPRSKRTRTHELVAKAVAQAKAKGDVEHEAFLRKFWNVNERDEIVARNFPRFEDGSESDDDDTENQTGCEHVNRDTKVTSASGDAHFEVET